MLILKVVHPDGSQFFQSDIRAALIKDGMARCFVLEPTKTQTVAGFSEDEVNIDIPEGSSAYLMNESGKTVSRFEAKEAAPEALAA